KRRKRTAGAIPRGVARKIDARLRVTFPARDKIGVVDLEAVEMALRAGLQQAGAPGLSQLLRQESPAESQGWGPSRGWSTFWSLGRQIGFLAASRSAAIPG